MKMVETVKRGKENYTISQSNRISAKQNVRTGPLSPFYLSLYGEKTEQKMMKQQGF